jgi:hypothetical protein
VSRATLVLQSLKRWNIPITIQIQDR